NSATSKSFTSPETEPGNSLAQKREIGPAPHEPATSADQDSSTELPSGQTIPSPVTTTRRPNDATPAAYAVEPAAQGTSLRVSRWPSRRRHTRDESSCPTRPRETPRSSEKTRGEGARANRADVQRRAYEHSSRARARQA